MSTAAPTSTSLAEPRALQTCLAPTKARPIAFSILWMPVPELPEETTETLQSIISETLKEARFADDPRSALNYFLNETRDHEIRSVLAFMKLTGDPSLPLMRYAVSIEDWPMGGVATDLLDTRVVINRSPPSEEILGKLLSSGVIGIGTYTGMLTVPAEANPVVMLVCVSGGIICISTSVGIGRALQDGIYERIRFWLGISKETTRRMK